MAKTKIDWLEQFADNEYKKMKKQASFNKVADQIIVDRSAYPNAKVGSLVDYDNAKYKIVDTNYRDRSGDGLLLERLAEIENDDDIKSCGGVICATEEEDDGNMARTAGKNDIDLTNEEEIKVEDEELPEEESIDDDYEYPPIVTRPGGVKPVASESITAPGTKKVTDAPYHPTFDPGEEYALDIDEDWQSAADRTADIINQEDAQDRTTVEGYYTWNQNIILDRILGEGPDEETDGLTDFDNSKDTIDEKDIDKDNDSDIDNSEEEIDTDDEDIPEDFDDEEANSDDSEDADIDIDDEDLPEDGSENDEEDIDLDVDENEDNVDEEDNDIDIDIDIDDVDNEDIDNEDINDEDINDEELPDEDEDSEDEEENIRRQASTHFPLSRLARKLQ